MNYITRENGIQALISDDGEIQTLQDSRFSWRERKEKTMRLYELYEKAGYPDYAVRARDCATFMQFYGYRNGEKRLHAANFCKLRLCPMCIGRRARRSAWKLSQTMDMVEQEYQAKFIFLTLTMKNVPGSELGNALGELTKAWNHFVKQRQIERSAKGWFRAIEITRGDGKLKEDNGYHPHIHAIIAVEPDYFSRISRRSGKYLNQSDLVVRWQKALRVDYLPSVNIKTTKVKRKNGGVESATLAAAKESSKYPIKDNDYINPKLPEKRAVEIVKDYTEALHHRRLTAFGGWLKNAAKKLDAEDLESGDLVHVDDDIIREDLLEMIESYSWHFGAGDFILSSRDINPLKVKRQAW